MVMQLKVTTLGPPKNALSLNDRCSQYDVMYVPVKPQLGHGQVTWSMNKARWSLNIQVVTWKDRFLFYYYYV